MAQKSTFAAYISARVRGMGSALMSRATLDGFLDKGDPQAVTHALLSSPAAVDMPAALPRPPGGVRFPAVAAARQPAWEVGYTGRGLAAAGNWIADNQDVHGRADLETKFTSGRQTLQNGRPDGRASSRSR